MLSPILMYGEQLHSLTQKQTCVRETFVLRMAHWSESLRAEASEHLRDNEHGRNGGSLAILSSPTEAKAARSNSVEYLLILHILHAL